jgi:hypothetical protein
VKCARIGHYWATDGSGARGVCLRCGRHGDIARSHAERPSETPSRQVGVSRVAVEIPDPVAAFDERPQHRVPPPLAERPAGAALRAEPNSPTASGAASSERHAVSTVAAVTVAAVSLAVLGGVAYLAFSRRKRRAR